MSKLVHIKVIFLLLAVVLLCVIYSADASKFNMSYLYGNYNYISLINRTNNSLNEVSPSYFDINDDGSLHLNTVDTNFVASAHQSGIKVVPFLSNHWDRTRGRAALSNIDKITTEIANAIKKYNFDGVNVDIENLNEKDRNNYTLLVKTLREKIPNTKSVSVAVAPNPYNWNLGWQASYDYSSLANYADYLMIMAYDEHYESGEAGSVASIQFVEKSVQYALKYVSKDKVVVGIPFFGRYWRNGASYGGYGVSLTKIQNLINNYKSEVIYDKNTESVKAVITISSSDKKPVVGGRTLYAGQYTFWYENEESIKAKINLVTKYDVKGTGSWSLGQETGDTWNYYAKALNGNTNIKINFIDVNSNSWAANYIDIVKENGLMMGKSSCEFAPTACILRAEFATTIARALKLNIREYDVTTYSDTKNHWAKNYIEAIREAGIMVGNGDGTFGPDNLITREEVAKVLSLIDVDGVELEGTYYFKDISPNKWSYEYILDVVQKGVMKGYPNNTFQPESLITREEVAAVIVRAFKLENITE